MTTLREALALAFPLVLLAACGTAGTTGEVEPEEAAPAGAVAVQVDNNLLPPTSLTVWLVSDTGSRQMLGTVSPSQSRTLDADVSRIGSDYRLVAEVTAGEEIASRPFVVTQGTTAIEWDLTANTISVR